jgi:DNA-binding SARP family transcriptional activator
LWRLRSLLDQAGLTADEIIEATRDTITLALVDTAVLDTAHFESLIIQAKSCPNGRIQLLQQAIALYEGDLCEGIYADWCLLERERLSRHYLWALGQLMAEHMQNEQYSRALEIGHCLLNQDLLREEVHRAIMLCHQRLGQHNQALQQFQTCSDLLQEELGIIPMPETLALYQQILASRFQTLKATPKRSPDIEVAYAEFLRASNNLTKLLNQ